MTTRRTLLVGAGKVGTSLGERLVAAGDQVVAIRRRADGIPPSFVPIVADLASATLPVLPEVDCLVVTLPPGDDSGFYRAALERLRSGLPAVPARTVFVSSTRVFEGWDTPRPLDESDEVRPASARAEQLVDGERAAIDLFGATVVRPAGIYGPGRERLLRQVVAGEAVDHERRTNRIHERDLVRLLARLLRDDDPPALVHAVDRRPATLGEVVGFIADRLGVARPPHAAAAPGARRGTVLAGAQMHALVPDLDYPTFVEGYGELVDARR